MPKSLRWHILGALWFLVGSAALLLSVEAFNRARLALRFSDITATREQLDRALLHVEDRHMRAVRRAREAMFDTRTPNTTSILLSTSQRYLPDMEASVADAVKTLQRVSVTDADARFKDDMERLRRQIDRILTEAQTLSPVWDALLNARNSEDNAALLHAQLDLERADRGVTTVLRVADGMIRSATTWQASHATGVPLNIPFSIWLLLGLGWLILVWWASQPVGRLHALAVRAPPVGGLRASLGLTREERLLSTRLDALEAERTDLAARLTERVREAERAQMVLRRVEHDLALLRFYNENLVNSLRTAIVVTDAAGHVTSINRVARALLSIQDDAMGSTMDSTLLYAAVAARTPNLAQQIEQAMLQRQALRYEAVSYGGGSPLLLDLTVAPYQDESGAARGVLWVCDDVTDTVHTKHQLLLAERLAAVGRLSAQVAHEIRNPLSAIGLNAELLEEELMLVLAPDAASEAKILLRAIGSEIERLTEVTETYLHMARLPRPNVRFCDINQLLADLFVMLNEEMRQHHVSVVWDVATPPPQTRVDPGQLRQALINIIRNSREAMADGGVLRVVTRQEVAGCRIEIHDNGPGIAPEVLPRVFEPFYSTKPQGTGLGLSLTQQIVSEHSGTVELQSQGNGTCVIIHLPDSDEDATSNDLAG